MADAPPVYGARGPVLLGITWTFFALTTILVGLRLYVKFGLRRPGLSTLVWLLTSYLAGAIAMITITISVVSYGIGNHIDIVQMHNTLSDALLWVWVAQFFALFSIALGKVTAVSFLLGLDGKTSVVQRILLWGLAIVNVGIDAATMIALWFQCDPVHKLWDTMAPGACNMRTQIQHLGMAAGSINGATDIILALFPIALVWNLQMPLKLKLGLCLLMGTGVFAGVCAAIKTSELHNISDTTDPTYSLALPVIWALVEMWVVLIVCAIPPLYPLVQSVRSTASHHYSHSGYQLAEASGSKNMDSSNTSAKHPYALRSDDVTQHTSVNAGSNSNNRKLPNIDTSVTQLKGGDTSPTCSTPRSAIMMRQDVEVTYD